MYCIHCGVKLPEGSAECPLCHTSLGNTPMPEQRRDYYSSRYPKQETRSGKILLTGLLSVCLAAVALGCLIFCLKSLGNAGWSGYAGLGILLVWIWLVLPQFFRRWRPMIFLPIDFAAAAGYLLYICGKTGGHWFLSFAFPVTALAAALTLVGVAMMRYICQGRLRLMSLLVIAIGLSFMLVEFFQHITFATPMFMWSLYCVTGFCMIGLFFFTASFITPLRAWLSRKFHF